MYNRISAMKPLVGFMLFAIALLGTLPIAAQAQLQQQTETASSLKLPNNEAYKEALKKSANTVYFTENMGQWEPSVVMEGETNIGSLVIKRDQLYFLSREVGEEHEEHEEEEEDEEHETFEAHGWGIFFDGMNPNFKVSKAHEIGTKYNYYIGNDPKNWASNVTAYGDVTMHNIYNGIDLRLYSQEAHTLEFDWIVNPGANYNDIKMRFKGPEGLRVDENGHLAVKLEFDEVKFDIPEAYQIIDGKKVPVTVKFKVKGDEATFMVEGKVDSRYPLVIDPSLKWGAFFDNNNNAFDEYLYAVDYDNQANVYCGGKINVQLSTSYVPTALYGFDPTYASNVDAILYKIKYDGTAILNVTYLGGTGNDGIYGMSLSPDKSRVFVCGLTSNGSFPTAGTPFDGTFNSGDGFVAAFPSSDFGSLVYSSFLGGDGSGDQMVTVRALSNTSYVVGGTVNNALPASYISNAYDATYSGNTEMWIGKFGTLNTLTFGTYIGGSDVEQLNDLDIFSDGSIAFSGYTASTSATFPGLVNTGGAAGAARDGVIGVIPANGGTFSMLSRIGGAGNDEFYGLTVGPFDTLFVTGFTSSSDLPLGPGASATTRFDVTSNGNQDGLIGKIHKGGGANSWFATYFGGSSNDRGNTLRTYTPYAIMAFGETGSNNFPVQNLDNGTFYDGTFNGSTWDIFWMVLGTDLKTQYFATYVGGNRDDYLGATGDPKGSNHFFVEGDSVITLGTTIHSRSGIQPTIVGPATGPNAVFDADPIATPNETSDDMHLIFKWRLGGNLLNFDYGDAPASYGTPNAIIFNSLTLGTTIDNEDFHPTTPGTRANVDDNTVNDDEDGISGTQVMIEDSAVTFSQVVSVRNTTGSAAYLIGWIDFNRNGSFQSTEQAKATVANGATSATLTWTVPAGWAAGAVDTSYLRLRLTADAAFNVTNPSATANSQNGEIEDYLVIRYHCVDLTPALVTVANPTSCTTPNGSITITNANLLANAQYGIYYRLNGGSPVGPFYLTSANNGSVTIPNLGAGTYTAIQVFHPTNPACGDTLNNPVVLTNSTTPPPSNLTASATCVGGTLTLTASGTALAWTGPSSFTASGSPVTRANATTAMSGTYSVTQTVNGCVSAPATISVTINTNPTVTATATTPSVCVGQTISLSSTPSPAGTYTYNWSGPASFTSTVQNPTRANAQTTHAGVYNVTVTAGTGCSATASTASVTVNANPTATAGTTTPTVCSGGTINLTSSALPSGTYTYSWSGPASFNSSAQNPSRTAVTTAMSGVYTVTITNSGTGCSATASTSNITVNQSPTVVASVGSPAYCTGQTISLSASPSGGTSPYTYSWSGPSSFTSTDQNPTRANATTAFAGVYNVTITDNNGCSGTAASPSVVVNQAPTVTAAVGSPTYCSGATLTLTSTPSPSGTYTYSWSGPNSFTSSAQNPTIPNVTTAATGAYTVTVTAGTNCSATATTGNTTVNQTPTATASSSSPTYCAGTTIQLNSSATPTGTYSYSWSGPASFTSTAQNPTRANSTTAMSGVYTVTITNTATNCSATASTNNITVNPGLSVSAGSNTPVCSGGTVNLTSNATGGTGTLTYNWSGPSFSSNLQNPSRTPATAAFAGVYNVTVSDVNNCSGTATTSVVVNPTATVSASSNSPVCSGAVLNLSASLSGGTSPFTYTWSGPAGFSSSAATPSRANALISYSGSYNVTVTDANGCSGVGTTSVVINQSPVVTAGSSSATYCAGATISLSSTVAGGATPYTYLWSGPASYSANTQNPSRTNALTTYSGVYTVTVTDANGCSGTASTPTITVNPSPAVTVASNSPVCANGTIALTSTPSSGTTPYTYLWSGPASFGSTAQNPTRTNALVSYSGIYSVTVTDANSCTATANTTVTVVTRPSTPVASSNSPVCTGSTLNLLGSGGTTGATWNWVGPNGFTSSVQNPSITNVTTAAAGTYRLYQTLGGCVSDTATTTVVVNVTPNAPTASAAPSTTLCSGTTLTLTAAGQVGATFTWSGPNGYSFVGNPAVRTNVDVTMAGAYTVTQTVTGCTSPASLPVNITINQTPTAPTPTTNSPKCYGDTLKIFASTVVGATYSWSGPSGYTAAVQNPTRPNATPAMSGTYSLTVTVNGCSSTNTATVNATVNSCPPIAQNDNYTTPEDVTLNVSAPGVLTNDSDPANPQQPLTVTGTPVSNPSHGTVTVLNGNGSFTYVPNSNFNGVDSFRYRVCDNEVPVACDTATVYVTVTPVNDPPFVPDTTISTCEDCPITVCQTIFDPETATQNHTVISILCEPNSGSYSGPLVNNGTNPHTLCTTYTPDGDFNGADSICIVICDNGSPILCDTTRIRIIVNPANDPPVANNDFYNTNEDTPITVPVGTGVRANDNDTLDGNPVTSLTVTTTPITNVGNGTLTLNADGSFTYTPAPNFNGVDSFRYRVCDNGTPLPSLCDTATAYITVSPVNDPPVVPDSSITTCEECPITVCLPIADPETATQSHNVSALFCGPNSGTLTGPTVNNGANPHNLCLTYTPSTNFNGRDSICIVVCDNGSPVLCDTTKIRITVTPVNDPPIAVNDNYTTNEDVPVVTNSVTGVRNNDNDIADGNPVTSLTVTTTPIVNVSHGTLVLNGDGSFTYTPAPNYNGTDSFQYRVCDNGTPLPSLCDTATAYITILDVNDPPRIPDTTRTTCEDCPITICLPITDPETATQSHLLSNIYCGPSHGTITGSTVTNTGNPHTVCINYTPTQDYNGSDTVCIVICDNGVPSLCDTSKITIIVTPVNDKPIAVDDIYVSCQDTAIRKNFMANDIDVDGPNLQYVGTVTGAGPYSGTLTSVQPLGNFVYTPPVSFNGVDSFQYIICDNGTPNLCDTAKVVLDYRCTNLPPIARNDNYTTPEDVTLNGNVSTNDNDPDGGTLTYTTTPLVTTSHGTVTLTSTGTFTYVPNANYFGPDSFVYRVCDNGTPSLCDTATAYITVTPVNDPPIVPDTTRTMCEDCAPITVCLPITDVDVTDQHFASIPCAAAHGTVTAVTVNNLSSPHTVCMVYTPVANYNGTDSFCVVVCDNGTPSKCDTAKVTITVTPVNDPPIANNDSYTIPEDVTLVTSSVSGVRNNDNDNADGNPVTSLTVTTTPIANVTNGTLTLNADGSFTYVPNLNFNGVDSFQYRVCDNGTPLPSLCDTATAYITITPVNDPPQIPDTTRTTCEDCPPVTVCLPITDPDAGDQHYAATPCAPAHGTVTAVTVNNLSNPHTVCMVYTPTVNYNGTDSFCVVVCDNGVPGKCDTSTVTIVVTPVNDPPVAVNDNYTTGEGVTLTTNPTTGVRNNDNDNADGNPVTSLTVTTTPIANVTHGTLTLNADGSFTYVPTPFFTGVDSFQYRVCDNGTPLPSLCDTATAYIIITPVNDPPFVPDTTITTCEDCPPTTVCLAITDPDAGDQHYALTPCAPLHGTVTAVTVNNLSNPHTVCMVYTPTTNYNGTDSFCVVVCDNGSPFKCDTSKITIIVTPVNDPPVAINDNYTTNEDVPVVTSSVTGVRNNDNDNADGNPVTSLTVTTTPVVNVTNGTLTLNADGSFTYTPNLNFNGVDSFQYRVCDNGTPLPSLCDTATAYITIIPVNDPPYVPDTTVTMCEDCPPTTVCLPITDPETTTQIHVASVCGLPAHGTISTLNVNNAGNPHTVCVTYTPTVNYNGTDSFCVIVCDNGAPGKCDTSTITIIVTPVNDPPVAVNDNYTTQEDVTIVTSSVTGVRNNDNDNADGNPVTSLTVTTTPIVNVTHGTLTLNADGSFTYVPTTNYFGTDSFQYRVCDNGTPLPSLCDTATAYITITPVNDPPFVPDTTITTCEDCPPTTVCLPISDNDVTDLHSAVQLCSPRIGIITNFSVNQTLHTLCFDYRGQLNLNGRDTVCYIVCDNGIPTLCDTTRITIIVNPVNDPPVANDDFYTTNEDVPVVTGSVTGVRNNDNDNADGNPVTSLTVTTTPINNVDSGTLVLNADGSFTYTPNVNFNGVDSFIYRICDSGTPLPSLCDTATAYITVRPVNDPPFVPDTTIHTCEDCDTTYVCVPITDADVTDLHFANLLCPATIGTVTSITIDQTLNTLCLGYKGLLNLHGTDSLCVVVCDNGTPTLCDTTRITIIVDPVNDPPYADTIYVTTYENQPVGVNVAAATGDVEGDPLSYTYGAPTPASGTYGITGNGAVTVTPNAGFTGTFAIPYGVCDLSPYPVNILCDNAAIIVTVLPAGDTLVNHAPVANNDYVTVPFNSPGKVINELANDYDPDGDALAVTVTANPLHGTTTVNGNGTLNYTPVSGYFGWDTIGYTICDPTAAHLPRPLCDQAIVVIYISKDSTARLNDPPVAVDDYEFVCANENAILNVLRNDYDPNGNALTSVTILKNFSHGTATNAGLGVYVYSATAGFTGDDTLTYRVCDNGTPSLCDTANAIVRVNANPVITPSVTSLVTCSNDSVNITFTSSVPGTTFTWTGNNGTSGTGNIHTVLTNATSNSQTVTYTVTGVSPSGCGSSSITIPVTVRPRPIATALQNGNLFCSGEQVVINLTSNVTGTQFNWSSSQGGTGTSNLITQTLTNTGTTNVTVTYTIIPTVNGCTGDTLLATAVVKPRPVVTPNPATQTSCSGQPVTIALTSNIVGTSVTWTGSNGNSGNTLTINDSPVNNTAGPITVTYTINSSFNGCVGNTVTATVVVRPAIIADAGADKSVSACSASCVTLGGSPSASGAPGPFTYRWRPALGLSDTTVANPTACNLTATTTYELIVTDTFGCFKNDFVTITVTPSSLTAEAGVGGALCLGSGDSVQLGGFPTAVGGTPPYTYAWSPITGLNLTNPANPSAFPTATTKYFVTVTDALGCQSVDSTTVSVYPTLIVNAGTDTTVCAGSPFNLGADTTARGGSGAGYTYVWSPTVGVSNINSANPTGVAFTTTTYAVTVTDGNGCTASDNILVTIRPTPAAQAGPDKTLTRCAGDSVIIGDNPAAIGGTPSYTYAWSPATGLSSTTVPNPVVRVGATTTYTLTVTDINGCTSTDAVTVNVVNSTLSVNAGTDKQICFGNCVQLGGIPTAVGGFPPYYFTWSNGNTLDDSTDANPVACPTSNTTYRLRATDSRGCVSIDDVTVIVNPNPIANAGADTTVCIGSSIQIGGAPTATGGTPGYTYSWNPSLGLSQPNVANPTAAPAVITTYQLIVTDTKGCIGLDEITVTPRTTPVVDAGADKTLVSCAADTVVIGGLPAVTSGGTAPFTYLWTPATGLSSATVQNPSVTGITATTSYQLIVTDSFGCSGNDFVVVNVVNSTLQVEAGNGGVVCAASGSPVQLGGTPTAVGGTSPYVYTWSPATGLNATNVANPIATVTSTTKYFLTVTDAKGCQAVDSVTVQQNATPVANAGADTSVCAGFCVNLNASATSGSGTYQYAWSPTVGLSNNNTPNPLACPQVTTTYIVTVTDSLGCNSTDAVTITILAKPVADAGADKSLTSCFADSVQIGGSPAATGGVAPYSYAWSPATGLSSTTVANPFVRGIASTTLYSLTVTDASGCTAVDVVQVNVVSSTLVANAGPDIFTCFNNSGATLTIGGSPTAVGGTGPYAYTWSGPNINAPTNAANITVSPITGGMYNVTVTDAKGCTATDFAIVNASTPVSVNAGADSSICAGTSINLAAIAPGATSYQWSPGTGLSSTTIPNPVATPTGTTTYTVTITYGNNCTASDAITITVRPRPTANAGPDRTMTACSADSVQLGGTPAATGGTSPYTYHWTPTAGLTDSLAARPWVKNLGATTLYTLNVIDAFGCEGSDQALVTVTGGTLSAEAGNNVSFCFGTATNVTLGGTPTAVGGTAPYTYTWSPAAGLSATNIANPVANTPTSRTYTVVVRDANGCEAQDTVRIRVNPRIVVNAGAADTVCAGSCITLGGAPTALGGSGSTYTYSWGPAIYFQGSNTIANPVVCPLNSVTYTVAITDSLGCTNTANVTIRVNANPVANAGADKNVVSCANACVTLGGSPTATSGTAPYLYAWSPSTALNNTGLPNPTLCGLGSTGNYTVTVTDANGCTSSDQVLVNTSQSTLVADAGVDKTICAGQNTCITIGGTPSVSGGVGPYSITWSPVGGMCTSNTIVNPQVLPTDTTTYVLLVSDANGCVAVDSMRVVVNPAVTASVGTDTAICNGSSTLLGGNPTGSGGTAPYTYLWNPSAGLSSITSANPTAAPNITTSYCVTVTDAVGCTASTCQRVDVNPAIVANAGADQTITACPGSFVQIGGTPTGTGGSGNYSYTWAPDSVGGVRVLNGTTIPRPIVTGLNTTTTFTVTVRDNVTGCFATDQVVVNVNQSTLTVDAGFSKVHCANSSSCVQIGGAPTASGGAAPYIYQWSPGLGLNSTTVANPCANPLITTNYAVTVTDALGCFLVDTVQVFVSPVITTDAGRDTIVCYNTSTVLGGTTVGGTGNYTFLWSPSQFLSSTTVARPTAVNVTSNITYTVTVTDSLGCSTTDIVTIGTRALPVASAGPDATIFACTADSVILGGSPTASGTLGPYTYAWTPAIPVPVNGSNPVVKNLGFGTNFTVLVTDSFGCQASDQVYVTVQPNTVFVDAGTNIGTLCSNVGSCVTLGGPVLGGTAPYTFAWSGGTVSNDSILNPQVCPLASTTYTIVVTDSRGCQASDTVRVIVNQAPNANITGLSSTYCVSAGNVSMTGIPAGGTFSGPGVTGNVFQPSVVGAGFYCIRYVYTDPATNCTDDTTICVTVNPNPAVTISGYEANYCRFDVPDTLVGSPAGGTFSGPGMVGNVFNPATANIGNNIISYSYSDSLGCSGLAQVTLVVRQVPTVSVTANDDTACVGQSVVLSPNYSTDVTNIQWSTVGGGIFASGLNPVTVTPTGVDYCVVATAINSTNGCATRDTVCLHVNQPPVANNDTIATCEEVVEVINVVANDTDPEGDASTVTVLSVNHGTTTVNGPFVTYTPNVNYNGLDTIVYALCNTQCSNACDTGVVAISICPVNDPPVITDIVDTIYQNQTDTVCPIAVDVDNTNLILSVLLCDTLNGTVTQIVNGCFNYTPTYNWIGTQTICVVACDSLGACDTGTVTIHVIPGNRGPRGLDVNVAVCKNTPIGVNVAAAAGDPNGNPLTFSYGTVSGPAGSNGTFTVTGNGAIVFSADSAGLYTFPYYVCDQSNLPPYSMCDTAIVTVRVYTCDSTNLPPVATDDIATVLVNTNVTINYEANDFDPNGDPLTTTFLSGPNLPGATFTPGANGTIIYTSPTTGVDSILYAVCDPSGLCDSAYIIIYVDSTFQNHPPVAVDDYTSTTYGTTVVVPVLNNDHDPDGNPITIQPVLPCTPADGIATVTGNTITYVPGPGLNALNPDTFCYVICDNAVPALCDTAVVVITVPNSVQAVNDTVVTTPYIPVVITVLGNDYDPETDSFYVTSVITGNTVGGVVLNPDGTVTYLPKDTCGFTDSFQYTVQDVLGAVDTATVYVTVNCCTPPVAVNDAATILPNAPFSINVLANDTFNTATGSGQVVGAPAHGTAVFVNDSVLTYTPAANYCGFDTITYRLRTNCGIDTAQLIVEVYCNTPPVANADTLIVCVNSTIVIDVLANDTDAEGDTLTVTSVSTIPGIGIPTLNANGTITFQAGSIVGPFTLFYTVCDSSFPNLCSTGSIRITIEGCTPIDIAASINATTCLDSAVTVCVGQYVSNATSFTITNSNGVDNGTVTIEPGDTCFTYTPSTSFVGNDTFTLTVCNTTGSCDSSQVVISVVDCLIDAIPDACDVNSTIINTSVNVNVLDNDLIPAGSDTTITIVSGVNNGMASINADNTIMVTPNTDYVGNITFTYEVCVTTGSNSYCDTASVCVNVIDTNCVIPTGFSPNGDGTNDEFEIPCNDQFPNSTLRVYNRWGVEVWASEGHYNNDFKGQNMQNTNLPDGTYFIIYDYKDGVTKPVQRYLVIHR